MSGTLDTALLLGGAGLVGTQVARRIAGALSPRRIVIASLGREEVREAVAALSREFPGVSFEGYFGDVFVRGEAARIDDPAAGGVSPGEWRSRPENRRAMFADVYTDFETAYRESALVRLILAVRPEVVVDTINTATAISYQDVYTASRSMMARLAEWREAGAPPDGLPDDVESLLISASVPQIIAHVRLLHRALGEAGVRTYLKIGTTGTGGMGLTIPYTHGEDKPSPTLMTKTSVAFAHTGLLWLMARTPGGPVVKELKPAAMIGFKDVAHTVVRGPQWTPVAANGRTALRRVPGRPYVLYGAREVALGDRHDTTPDFGSFTASTDEAGEARVLTVPCVNTGENGYFARGEFEAITHLDQMEMITPEEIADAALIEIRGGATGRDVLAAVDSAILGPSYKGGVVRRMAIEELARLEDETGVHSVALGQLGPPQLSKYLYEAHLIERTWGTLPALAGSGGPSPEAASDRILRWLVEHPDVRDVITSIGIPILAPDGRRMFRGPVVSIPPYRPGEEVIDLSPEAIDAFAKKGWVDLRPSHLAWWIEVFKAMLASAGTADKRLSSERFDRRVYFGEKIRIGEVVAWIFNNRLEPAGHRMK